MTDFDYEKLADLISSRVIVELKKDHEEQEDHQRSFEWAIENIFCNKSRDWIKFWIFNKHPEVLSSNGGWITEPGGRGKRIKVLSENDARKWLKENRSKIDWNAPEPVTIRRRAGLAKPIKRNSNK